MKPVKYFFLFLLPVAAFAQDGSMDDTVRVAILPEVQITTLQKSQQQNLCHFFGANKAATTEDILGRLPELSLIRRGNYGMEPVIRSYNAAQVSLLLDGMKIHGACTDKMDPASIYIEPANLKSIEVRTNGSSLVNGSSIGGSINMKLADVYLGADTGFSGTARSGYYTAARAFYESLHLNYATAKWGLRATGTYRKSDDYKDGSGKRVPFSQYEKVNYSLQGRWALNENTYLKVHLLVDDGWNIGYAALPMDVGYASARIGAISVVKEKSQGGWQKIEAKMYANRVRHYMDDTHRPNVAMHMDMPGSSFTTGLYVEGTKSRKSRELLTIRADASVTSLKASMTMYQNGQLPMYMLTWPDNRQLQSGLAAQYTVRFNSAASLQVNARGDYSGYSLTSQAGENQLSVFGYSGGHKGFLIPSLSAQVTSKLYRNLKAALSAGINGRVPTASEMFGFYLFNQFDGYDYIGNTALKNEVGQQVELTLSWQTSKLKIQVTGYVSRVNHYILGIYEPVLSVMTVGAKGVKVYRNIDYALLAGAEGSVVYNPIPHAQIISTLKYAYGRDKERMALPMMAPLRNTSAIRYEFEKIWLQAEFEGAAAQNRVSEAANERKTGAFWLWHLRLGYRGAIKHVPWELNSGMENIFNTFYREHLDWGNVARPGRNFYIQMGIGF